MIQIVDKKYCSNNVVEHVTYTDTCHLIMNASEIILLKIGDKVLINKYPGYTPESSEEYSALYEYNKPYLNFRGSTSGYTFHKDCFFKGTHKTLWLNESLLINRNTLEANSQILTREKLQQIFNSDNYDSMYVIDINGTILLAKTLIDGLVIKTDMVPTDEEIIDIDYQQRVSNHYLGELFRSALDNTTPVSLEKSGIRPKTIAEITNLNIYGSTSKYAHILVTSKDGKLDVKYFRLDYIGKDQFGLTTVNIPIREQTINDVSKKSKNELTYEDVSPAPKARRKWPSWLHPKKRD